MARPHLARHRVTVAFSALLSQSSHRDVQTRWSEVLSAQMMRMVCLQCRLTNDSLWKCMAASPGEVDQLRLASWMQGCGGPCDRRPDLSLHGAWGGAASAVKPTWRQHYQGMAHM
jgi:hypothetical protein